MKGQQTFWYPSGVQQTSRCQATASQSLEMHFLQKHKMAATGLVWPGNFLVKKQKLLIFVNHWRTAKSGNSDINNELERAILFVLAFWPLLN